MRSTYYKQNEMYEYVYEYVPSYDDRSTNLIRNLRRRRQKD